MSYSVSINSSQSTNEAANQSTVYVSLTLTATNQGYSGYNTSFTLYIGGTLVANDVGPSALNTSGVGTQTWTSSTYSLTYNHNPDGTRGAVGTSGAFYGGGGYSPPAGGIGASGATYGAIDWVRPPISTGTPSLTARTSGSTSITMSSTADTTGRPGLDYFRWKITAGSTTTIDATGAGAGAYTWPSADTDTDYTIVAQAHSSEGFGPDSAAVVSYAAPRITNLNIPNQGTVGKPYSGTMSGNNVSSYSVATGSLPPGLSIVGGTITGAPTLPGIYTFTLRATRTGVSSVDSASQTIQVLAGGPWIATPDGVPVYSGTITNVAVNNNVAAISTGANHGISELNQPITISGLTGAHAALNGSWFVQSWPTANTLTFNTVGVPNISPATALGSGTFQSLYKRSSLKVYIAGTGWVQGWMRYYDAATQQWKTTA